MQEDDGDRAERTGQYIKSAPGSVPPLKVNAARPDPDRGPMTGPESELCSMADALLLGGARVIPRQLEHTGYRFAYPRLEQALQHLLNPPTGHHVS